MSQMIQKVLAEEGAIEVTMRIPVDFGASDPEAHLANEGRIEEAVREAGRTATQVLYQAVADRHNRRTSYRSPEGYRFRREHTSQLTVVCPYGNIEVTRPHFRNDHRRLGDAPFERETGMRKHHVTPLAQYLLLERLAEKGPEATARDFERHRGVRVSHHLVDRFLEDFGMCYQELRPELVTEVIREDWRPSWRPSLGEGSPESAPCSPSSATPTPEERQPPSLLETLCAEAQRPVVPVVQMDAMKVAVREYEARIRKGKKNYQKYQIVWRELQNLVLGFLALQGPRKPNDRVELRERRYLSEFYAPDSLPFTAANCLRACGVPAGSTLVLNGDGDPRNWTRFAEAFRDYRRIEILDLQHCRLNLRTMADLRYPEATGKAPRWVQRRLDELFQGRFDAFFEALNYLVRSARDPDTLRELRTKRQYFRRNNLRIRYRDFLAQGYPISTCFVESAHNHVIGIRVRKNGRSYRDDRLQLIADFRCEFKSDRLPYVFQRVLAAQAHRPLRKTA